MIQPVPDSTPSVPVDDAVLGDLVEQARAGDSLAFDSLFHSYNTRICTYLGRMVGDNEEGRDLAQETFTKAWQTLSSLHDVSRFGSWLYRIATNVAIDYLRNQRFRWLLWRNSGKRTGRESMQIAEGHEEHVVQAEHVRHTLAQLSPKYRACLLLQIEGGFSQREIAELLNMGEKNVSVYVRRGCEQFRREYEHLEHGRASSKKRR